MLTSNTDFWLFMTPAICWIVLTAIPLLMAHYISYLTFQPGKYNIWEKRAFAASHTTSAVSCLLIIGIRNGDWAGAVLAAIFLSFLISLLSLGVIYILIALIDSVIEETIRTFGSKSLIIRHLEYRLAETPSTIVVSIPTGAEEYGGRMSIRKSKPNPKYEELHRELEFIRAS